MKERSFCLALEWGCSTSQGCPLASVGITETHGRCHLSPPERGRTDLRGSKCQMAKVTYLGHIFTRQQQRGCDGKLTPARRCGDSLNSLILTTSALSSFLTTAATLHRLTQTLYIDVWKQPLLRRYAQLWSQLAMVDGIMCS